MKKSFGVVIVAFSFILVVFSFSLNVVYGAVGNQVEASVSDFYDFFISADSVENIPIIFNHKLHPLIHNFTDVNGDPSVFDPKIELNSNLDFTGFSHPEYFSELDLGHYVWDFDGLEIPSPDYLGVFAYETTEIIKPGYSVTRSVDPIILTESSTTQTITVYFTLEEELFSEINWIQIRIGEPGLVFSTYKLVESNFVSQNQVDGWNEYTDGVWAWWDANPINIEVGKTYIFQAKFQAVKSDDLIGSPIFKPPVSINYARVINLPFETSSSITITDPEDDTTFVTFSSSTDVDWVPFYRDYNYLIWLNSIVSYIFPPDGPPFYVGIPANVTIKPETLNRYSNGKFSAFIQLSEPYKIEDIDIQTVVCEGASVTNGVIEEGFLVLNLKFNRQDLIGIEPGESIEFTVTGDLTDGTKFKGTDNIRVID